MRRAVLLWMLVAGACTHRPTVPVVKLAPASLQDDLSVEQRLQFNHGTEQAELQALLEVDRSSVRLAAMVLGETAERLVWDGTVLREQRAPWLPADVSGERILSDLQLMLWPVPAVRAGLPVGCALEASAGLRVLRCDASEVARVEYDGTPPRMARAVLHQWVYHYELIVETHPP